MDRLDRSQAALQRSGATARRAQAHIDREVWESQRELARQPPGPGGPIERAETLRRRLSAMSAALTVAAEVLAQTHEELAGQFPARASDYRRSADQARKAAHQAREIGRQFSD